MGGIKQQGHDKQSDTQRLSLTLSRIGNQVLIEIWPLKSPRGVPAAAVRSLLGSDSDEVDV